jgi:hypothetical protein
MGTTVIGPTSQAFPSRAIPAVVQLKRNWSDDWTFVPELEFLGASASTAAHDAGSCALLHRYGVLKHPWEPTDGRKTPVSLAGCWARVMLAGQQGMQEAWIGRIVGEVRTVFGPRQSDYGLIPAGAQCFEALGPLAILRRIDVGRSCWRIGNQTVRLDWVAPLNEKYGRNDKPTGTKGKALGTGPGAKALGSRSGNRSQSTDDDGVYVHGDFELWDYLQYAKYILAKFVDESYRGGPSWKMGGQCDVLSNFTDPIQFGVTQNVEHILRSLIRPEYGLDYKIVSTGDGFEVRVFVLTRQSCGWGGQSLPGNPDTVKIYAARTKDSIKTCVEKTAVQRYGTIRLLGGRIVVCCSLHGNTGLPNGKPMPGNPKLQSIATLWIPKDQNEYNGGTGTPSDAPFLHDEARQQEKFRDVYRKFGAAPNWFKSNDIWHSPQWNGQGQPLADNGPLQQRARSTLPWIPLETGVDYSQKPCVDNNPATLTPTLRLPQAWLYDSDNDKWAPADANQIGLSALPDALGVFLHAHPNHLVAKGNFSGPSDYTPEWSYWQMIVTLAYFTDQRVYCEQKIQDAAPTDGVLEVDASDCQCWWLAPDTFLDIDKNGQAVLSPTVGTGGTDGMIVRNDWARLSAKMAGALARHYQERARAQIVVRGLLPWGGLLGQILTVIDEGGDSQTIEAPITDIRWMGGDNPTTVISTGFARE